ncbi:CDP-diacylglycerol--glycerol-3-phosphate 3-phosphatidyltransferase [Sulfoacidibacillus thermotolerans]|uniref:CDP-diacylglycerol--glycerol-3-phosphate 3-phosphatidyltransferase n=1 Tax=Sulfoacidibacillus thermotolerans TaxID=1765684 RepID=A0A2U3DAF8_SULT2|nr:CDP-diacylglycerol--glycerol-3-phosphate 3-phosphatidyltransferase [Sulfoacidibacillus thermotolerans]PWI58242.1 CDP-diacylglycerol--glycerol-3-phosphate 3-phosphatidyltransferase [Sulfoacidibacillus thermotolerans]
MNLANRITVARMIMVPVVMLFLLVRIPLFEVHAGGRVISGGELIAAFVFIIAASTDSLDGYIARKRKLITNFGKFMDPLADKLLVSTALICLVALQKIPAWIAILIIAREFAVTGLRAVASTEGEVIAASGLGKWKTILQMIALVEVMIGDFPFSYLGIPFDLITLYAAAIMTIVSGVDYFLKNRHVLGAQS